ncbi:hypothetical protein Q9L58_001871 [Maublancomyces gigas]|uniref:HNH nuclease domain-containing protein n=1 Tax=Discina gigas TaxID=1032678 RepID=A0ABR3GSS1_9PEZI
MRLPNASIPPALVLPTGPSPFHNLCPVAQRLQRSFILDTGCHPLARSETIWFPHKGLHIYNFSLRDPSPGAIDDVHNGMLMRRDLHFMFNQNISCPVVKCGTLVSHHLKRTRWPASTITPRCDARAFEERMRLVGRVIVEDDKDMGVAADVTAVRKRGGNTSRGSKSKRGGRGWGGVGRRGTPANRTDTNKNVSGRQPHDVSARHLAGESGIVRRGSISSSR